MSFHVPGEETKRAQLIADDLGAFSPEAVLRYASDLRNLFRDKPRHAGALPFWDLVYAQGETSTLAELTTVLIGGKAFAPHFEATWKKASDKQKKRLLEMLEGAREETWEDDEKKALTELYYEKKGLSADDRLVVDLTSALSSSDEDDITRAVKAIVAPARMLAVSKEQLKELANAIGQSGTPSELVLVGPSVPWLGLKGELLERILAQTIGGAQMANNLELEQLLIKLVPKKITWDILAYNLACNAALRSDRPRLLEMTKAAVSLGKRRSQFIADSDFAPFLKDAAFLALLPKD